MTNQKHYLWLDLETTGLDPERCGIIEVAAVLTTRDMRVVAEYEALVSASGSPVWEPEALIMHAKNGLIERWVSAADGIRLYRVDTELNAMLSEHSISRPILAGSSVHFDRGFIRAELPGLDGALHYRHLDVSAITEMMATAGHETPDAPPSEHRAMSDIRRSMALYEHWLNVATKAHNDSGAKLRDTAQQLERLADHVRWRQFVLPADISFKLRKIAQEVAP